MTQDEIARAMAEARRLFLSTNPVGYLRKVRVGRAEWLEIQRIVPSEPSSGILLGPLKGVLLELVDADNYIEVIYERF